MLLGDREKAVVRVICRPAKGNGRRVGRGGREAGRLGPAPSLTRGRGVLPPAQGDSTGHQKLGGQRHAGCRLLSPRPGSLEEGTPGLSLEGSGFF